VPMPVTTGNLRPANKRRLSESAFLLITMVPFAVLFLLLWLGR